MAQTSVVGSGQLAGRWKSRAAWGLASVVALCLPACAQPWPEVGSRPGANAPEASAAWVAQLAAAQGGVWLYDRDQSEWLNAQRDQLHNWPVSSGDRLRTDTGARSTLRVGALTLRLDGDSDLELLRLDADQLAFRLWRGTLAVQVLDDAQARRTLLVGAEARATPQRSGHYRLAVDGGKTVLTTWRGELRVTTEGSGEDPLPLAAGRELALWRDAATGGWRQARRASQPDDFADWALAEGRLDQAPQAAQYVSAEASGWQALDAHGQWREDPQWGKLWVPRDVEPGWAPYRDGRWAWVAPWGWTWIDTAPWGFATYHYGQWVAWRGGWAWAPAPRQQRPVFRTVQPGWSSPPPRMDRPVQPPPRVDRPAHPLPWAGFERPINPAPPRGYDAGNGPAPYRGAERPAEPPPNKTVPANPWPSASGPVGRGAPAPLKPETSRPAAPAAEVPNMPTPRVPGAPRRGFDAPPAGGTPAPAKPPAPVTSPTQAAPIGPVAPVRPVMPPPVATPARPEAPRAPDAPPKAVEPPVVRSDNKAEQPNKSWR